MHRRAARGALVLAATVLAAACAGSAAPAYPPAEIAAGGPDCLADEVVDGMVGAGPGSGARPAPAAGAVPPDFVPVGVVQCLPGPLTLLPSEPVPQPDLLEGPAARDRDRGATPEPPRTLRVTERTLTGDLGPLLAALSRPSEEPRRDQPCPAMWESRPQIYLVDSAGRAVRARWPVTSCGFLHEGAAAALDGLQESASTVRTLRPDGPPDRPLDVG